MISVSGINEELTIFCLSTDEKPVGGKIPNGCLLIYIDDTSKAFIYDKESKKWYPVQ